MTKRNHLFNKTVAAMFSACTFFLNGANAQPEDQNLAPVNIKAEDSRTQGGSKMTETILLNGHIVIYRIVIDQKPWSLFKQNPPVSQVFLDIVDGRSVIIRQSTLVFNAWTKFYKTWEHEVTSSRACAKPTVKTTPLQDTECIAGRKNIIKLPQGSSPFDFAYFIEWTEGGTLRRGTAILDARIKPVEKKLLR
jgi:hypothetical protein